MAAEYTVKLPADVYRRAEQIAERIGRSVEEVLGQVLESSLPNLHDLEPPLSERSDSEILALAHLRLSDEFAKRNSELLDRQQADILTDAEQIELQQMTYEYQIALLRKSQGIREAVERGLPLDL